MILFIWGRKRVLPVNINSMTITETEFHTNLEPIRATVAVDLTVIEGPNPRICTTKSLKEVMSGLHLANLRAPDVMDVVKDSHSEVNDLCFLASLVTARCRIS